MNSIEQIQNSFFTFLISTFSVDQETAKSCTPTLNTDENKAAFGDITSNAAMVLAKLKKQNPRILALQIIESFSHPLVEKIEVAGAGFLNFYFKPQAWHTIAHELSAQKVSFFKPSDLKKSSYSFEFVSANPTGPLHFGHGRGGIIGDVLGRVLRFIGHDVTTEFYINDAGNQINNLGISFKARCLQALGKDAPVPEDGYHGQYLLELAQTLVSAEGEAVLEKENSFFEQYAKTYLLEKIKLTLEHYGIVYDVWFSEKTLHSKDGAIDHAIEKLIASGHLYESEGALWFRSTTFGDDKDRVVKKTTGEWTYIAADIAYLVNKIERGLNPLVMVLGHDHHSYAVRLNGIRQALGFESVTLDFILYQLVRMKQGEELVKLSKRAGNIISLDDVIDSVGVDVARFFYLHRKADAHLDFDLELAKKKTDENPVYYMQYAYVRINSLLSKASTDVAFKDISEQDAQHLGTEEYTLLRKIVSLKDLLTSISGNYHTHLISYYAIELADAYHRYYSNNRVIDPSNIPLSRARLYLMSIVHMTMGTVFDLMGISKPERM